MRERCDEGMWVLLFSNHKCTEKVFGISDLEKPIIRFPILQYSHCRKLHTLRSQIDGYTRLLIFRKFSTLPAVIWASPFINFQENFQPPCFFTYTNEKISTLPADIWAYPLIKFEEKFQPTLLLDRASPCIRDLRVCITFDLQ